MNAVYAAQNSKPKRNFRRTWKSISKEFSDANLVERILLTKVP